MDPHDSLFVAVPTTAGTGSEVSESAIVAKKGTDYKMVLRSPNMSARLAILDPELGVTAPPKVTATAGYDAVTHAVEAYTSKAASPMTDPFARSAMELLARWLPVAYAEPQNVEARGACLIGSMQAGIAFNSAHLGLAHAIAGAMGALHHTPHGLANALALPWSMAFNQPELGDKGDIVAGIFGADSSAWGLSRLRKTVGLDIGLDEIVTGSEALDQLAEGASKSGQIKVNPRLASVSDIRVILEHMRRPTDGLQPNLNL
jgi:alcohol dehydrogenase